MNDRFRVPMPEAGEKAYIVFDFPAMEELEDFYGPDYLDRVATGLDRRTISVIRKSLSLMLKDANVADDALIAKFTLAGLCTRISDAISLAVYGYRLSDADAMREMVE